MVADLPGVGQNLHDHVQLLIFHPTKKSVGDAAFTAEAGLFMHSQDGAGATSPDLQFHVLSDFPGAFPNFPIRQPPPHPVIPSFLICPVLCRPQSRGTVRLCSADSLLHPIIDPNYLQCDADVEWPARASSGRSISPVSASSAPSWTGRSNPSCIGEMIR